MKANKGDISSDDLSDLEEGKEGERVGRKRKRSASLSDGYMSVDEDGGSSKKS